MAKSVFGIILDKPDPDTKKKVVEKYPGAYPHSETLILVETDDVSKAIRDNIGWGGDGNPGSGVVFRLSPAYSGFTSNSLWEWLNGTETLGRG